VTLDEFRQSLAAIVMLAQDYITESLAYVTLCAMKPKHTHPEVFILESLRRSDKQAGLLEGKIIKSILRMGGKEPLYHYVESQTELENAAREFAASSYRYLHVSCHGNASGFEFYFGPVSFSEFAALFHGTLRNRRVFVSACECVNPSLVGLLIPSSKCYSVIGPYEEIDFDVAAVIWASYYYMAFRNDESSMSRIQVLRRLRKLTKLFGINLDYYSRSRKKGIRRKRLKGS
jgi:hypothetical protein